jgi:hypothetical protein
LVSESVVVSVRIRASLNHSQLIINSSLLIIL